MSKEALEKSIQHWEHNAVCDPSEISLSFRNCALCGLYFNGTSESCAGCPVFEHTGYKNCGATPYAIAFNLYLDYGRENGLVSKQAILAEFREMALKEVEFLKSLRGQYEDQS